MKLKYYILSVLACLIFSISVSAQTGYESEGDLKKKAEQLWKEKDFPGALPLYSQLLSLYPKDPEYNYKFGTCMLHVEEDKSAPLRYLEYAASRPNVDPEALFYLGKAYHLNYRFKEAQSKYSEFKEKGSGKDVQTLNVDLHIQMCKNGSHLLSNITDLAVLDKRTLSQADFFRSYDVSSFGGKIISKPEDFELAADKKVDEQFIMYLDRSADRIYYSSYGEKGKSGKDIYYSKKLPDGAWGEPQSIGSTINTPYDEDYPFFNTKTNTMYFSSKGHNSMGGYDVFKSTYNPSSDTWSKPQNMDYAVNTPDNDFLYITNASEKTAYFATTRSSVSGEVTVYKVNVERIPVDFTIIKGTFFSEATKSAKITVEDIQSGEIIGIWNTNGNTGGYLMTLPNGGSFKFIVETAESPVAYFGNVEIPYLKKSRPLKQEMELVVMNGMEILRINNPFDEIVESDGTLLTADFLKDRANLEINAEEVAETEEAVEVVKETIELEDNSAEEGKEFSNAELVKMAYEDAEEMQQQAKAANAQTEIAYAIANQRNNEATEKSKEADQLSADAQAMENERDKLNKLKEANDLRVESNELAKEAVIAYNLGNKLKERSENLASQSEQALEVALQLDNAINSNSQSEIDDAYTKIQGLLATEIKDDVLAEATGEYDEKKTASEKQIQKAIKLREEANELEKDLTPLKGRASNTKDKDEKALLEYDIGEMEEELVDIRMEEQEAMASAKSMQAETDELEEEAELMADVVEDIKSADSESIEQLSTEDKQRLASDISSTESSIATVEAATANEQEQIKELTESVTGYKYEMEEGPESTTDSESSDTGTEEETSTETEEPLVSIEGEEGTSDAAGTTTDSESSDAATEEETSTETEDPLIVLVSIDSEGNSFVKTDEIPQENYESYFEEKEGELDNISNETEKAAAEVDLYNAWLNKTNGAMKAKEGLIAEESDEVTKQVYEMELEELKHNQGKQENQLQEAKERLAATNELEDVEDSYVKEAEIPNDNYDFYFEEKLAEAEQLDNPLKKEEAKSDIYKHWVDQMSNELYAKKEELETAPKSEKKDLKARISVLETELEDKRLNKAMADIQANKILEEQPELATADSESADTASEEDTSTGTEEPLVSIEGKEGTSDAAGTTADSESSDTATEEDTSTETEEPLVSIEGEEGTSDAAGTTADSESSDTSTEEDTSTETEEPLVSIEGEEGTSDAAGTTTDSESSDAATE
ncbi:MAG: hypothetical protein JKY42_08480, partial [Flavobacteriales bacterium]|nr:hypothetical protein [Flavobacteriales bacterium]